MIQVGWERQPITQRATALSVLVVLGTLLTVKASAQPQQSPRVWSEVTSKIANAHDYHFDCIYRYQGATYRFDYAVADHTTVRVRIMPGSSKYVGAISLYRPDIAADKLLIRFPSGSVIARDISHHGLAGAPLHRSIYDRLVAMAGRAAPPQVTARAPSETALSFALPDSCALKVWVDGAHDIVRAQVCRGGQVTESMRFTNIAWNTNPPMSLGP